MSAIAKVIWPAPNKVLAVTTTRQGGMSISPYDSFNLGSHVDDSNQAVEQNRNILLTQLANASAKKIQWLNQIHSSDVVNITRCSTEPVTADAAYTTQTNLPLAILTADCVPILLVNQQATEIAAIHGGWRPLAGNIIENTVAKFTTPRSQLMAWLGPCIGPNAFEVGIEVKQQFCQLDKQFAPAFRVAGQGKFLADLQSIARIQLQQLGITAISAMADCTYTNPETYFSYRRDGQTGRMASVICISS
ncbi:hypothetical protein A9Q98_05300 [Thalassotalea sp. 42_200_T64]|nr:hypothetical protein A9Q98_05300 [Thalassotalea sp. 42_200_T64]